MSMERAVVLHHTAWELLLWLKLQVALQLAMQGYTLSVCSDLLWVKVVCWTMAFDTAQQLIVLCISVTAVHCTCLLLACFASALHGSSNDLLAAGLIC